MLLLALVAQTAVDAERAFAREAATGRQWPAFVATSLPDGVMFDPQPVRAHVLLADAPANVTAPIQWWPADSYVACDGTQAVNTGPWVRAGGSGGYFTTVWVRQPNGGWKWVMDGGDVLPRPRATPERARVRTARCGGRPSEVPAARYADGQSGEGGSDDRSLQWRWHVSPDGARSFDAWLWNGRAMMPVVQDRIAAAKARP